MGGRSCGGQQTSRILKRNLRIVVRARQVLPYVLVPRFTDKK